MLEIYTGPDITLVTSNQTRFERSERFFIQDTMKILISSVLLDTWISASSYVMRSAYVAAVIVDNK